MSCKHKSLARFTGSNNLPSPLTLGTSDCELMTLALSGVLSCSSSDTCRESRPPRRSRYGNRNNMWNWYDMMDINIVHNNKLVVLDFFALVLIFIANFCNSLVFFVLLTLWQQWGGEIKLFPNILLIFLNLSLRQWQGLDTLFHWL